MYVRVDDLLYMKCDHLSLAIIHSFWIRKGEFFRRYSEKCQKKEKKIGKQKICR